MTKFAVVFVLAAFICITKVKADDLPPLPGDDGLTNPSLPPLPPLPDTPNIEPPNDVLNQPLNKNGNNFHSISTSSFQKTENKDGKVVDNEHGGHISTDDNGVKKDISFRK